MSSCLIFPPTLDSHNSSRSPCVTSVLSILEASSISMPSVKPSPHLARIMCQDVSRCPNSTKNVSRCATSVYNVTLFGQMVKPPGRMQGADCPRNHLSSPPLSTSRVVRGLSARSSRKLNHPHLQKKIYSPSVLSRQPCSSCRHWSRGSWRSPDFAVLQGCAPPSEKAEVNEIYAN